ncbi:MAG: hypothetical protein B7Z09_10645 [Brevundimonas diminuta]|nr:MAG: hypothetical protein B7Z09_10645 [Brevundimonas diminuta]
MNRAEFLARLRRGLVGLPAATANEIVADYEAHFADGAAAGRSEAEVAEALGDPDRLSRELKAEAGAQRWRQEPSASSAAGAVFGILGLGAIDILILLPIALPVFGTVLSLLLGVGLMGLGIFMVGTMALLTKWLIDATVWYARLHYRVIKPALEPQA